MEASFRYIEASLSNDDTCTVDIRIRISAAMTKLDSVWKINTIGFPTKYKLFKTLVVSLFLYGCETRTHLADFGHWKENLGCGDQVLEKAAPNL